MKMLYTVIYEVMPINFITIELYADDITDLLKQLSKMDISEQQIRVIKTKIK